MQFKLFQEKLQEAYGKLIACMDCGYNEYLVGIDWHHLNPSEKDKNIAEMKTYSVERLQQELQKCIPLCAICHRVRHLHEGKALG